MRGPINYTGRRFAREVANNYSRGRRNNDPPDPSGCLKGCLFALIIWVLIMLLATCSP